MSEEIDLTESDEDQEHLALLARLRELTGQLDPVPADVVGAARASLTWRTIDEELAELAHDSLLDDQPVLVRGSETPRLLTFEASGLTVDVEVSVHGEERRLVGQLVPAEAASIEVRHPGGTATVEADELGRFTATGLSAGLLSLRCRLQARPGAPVATAWVSV